MQPKCPWCGLEAAQEHSVCAHCYQKAIGIPELSEEEVNALPFGVIELDEDGKILAFNRAEEERACVTAEEVIGKNFFRDIAPCTQVKEYEGRFKQFLASDEPSIQFSFTYTLPHGKVPIHILLVRTQDAIVLIVSKERVA
jgi:photoactive yellow protein